MVENGERIQRLERLNEEELKKLAAVLSSTMKNGLVLLMGNLGAGKTTFVKGMARGLGIKEEMVTSPTFVIMNVYEGISTLYHVDLYRIGDPEELFYIGLEEVMEDEGIVAVEWADLFPEMWEDIPRIEVKIWVRSNSERDLEIKEIGEEGILSETISRWKEEKTR